MLTRLKAKELCREALIKLTDGAALYEKRKMQNIKVGSTFFKQAVVLHEHRLAAA